MSETNFKPREVERAIEEKVRPDEARSGKENNFWYYIDNKKMFRVTVPKTHGHSSVPTGTLKSIRGQLKLDKGDFARLVQCSMSGADYEKHIRALVSAGIL